MMEKSFNLFFMVLVGCGVGVGWVSGASVKCEKTVTTATFNSIKKSSNDKKVCSGDLIFEDTFDKFDFDVWSHDITLTGERDGEFQWYTNNRSNSYIEDGNLHIRTTLTSDDFSELFLYTGTLDLHHEQCTNDANSGCRRSGSQTNILNPIKSARIRTLNSFSFRYGKVEINAKMPSGDWLWPSIKFQPKHNFYGHWPASGEIDLVTLRGNRELVRKGVNIGNEQITSALHFGPYKKALQSTSFGRNLNEKGKTFASSFHRYQMEWNPEKIIFSIDDVETASVKAKNGFWEKGEFETLLPHSANPWKGATNLAPFDQEFYLSMNLAVGGDEFFPDDAINSVALKPWTSTKLDTNTNSNSAMTDFWNAKNAWLPTWKIGENRTKDSTLQIDYVRVWAL